MNFSKILISGLVLLNINGVIASDYEDSDCGDKYSDYGNKSSDYGDKYIEIVLRNEKQEASYGLNFKNSTFTSNMPYNNINDLAKDLGRITNGIISATKGISHQFTATKQMAYILSGLKFNEEIKNYSLVINLANNDSDCFNEIKIFYNNNNFQNIAIKKIILKHKNKYKYNTDKRPIHDLIIEANSAGISNLILHIGDFEADTAYKIHCDMPIYFGDKENSAVTSVLNYNGRVKQYYKVKTGLNNISNYCYNEETTAILSETYPEIKQLSDIIDIVSKDNILDNIDEEYEDDEDNINESDEEEIKEKENKNKETNKINEEIVYKNKINQYRKVLKNIAYKEPNNDILKDKQGNQINDPFYNKKLLAHDYETFDYYLSNLKEYAPRYKDTDTHKDKCVKNMNKIHFQVMSTMSRDLISLIIGNKNV